MSTDQDFDPLLPAAVEAVLEAVQKVGQQLPPDERDTFAFNVFVNALASVLEELRAKAPEQYRTHLGMALLMLQGEDGPERPR